MNGLGTVGAAATLRAGASRAGGAAAGSEPQPIRTGQLAVFGPGDALTIAAPTRASRSRARPNLDVLILGGRPIREPVAWMGPFVMNTREEVVQAVRDYQAGRLGSIPAVHGAPTTVVESDAQATRGDRRGRETAADSRRRRA